MLYFLIGILLLTGMVLIWLVFDLKKKLESKKEDERIVEIGTILKMMLNQNSELRQSVDDKLAKTHQATQSQYEKSMRIISDVTERLTKLDETNKQVVGFSAQLQNLQDILRNPKQRGIFGEYYLETLLKNAFNPKQYQMQYGLGKDEKTGKELVVDAVLFVADKIIPIDSKFSLENYNRIMEENDPVEKERLEKNIQAGFKKPH